LRPAFGPYLRPAERLLPLRPRLLLRLRPPLRLPLVRLVRELRRVREPLLREREPPRVRERLPLLVRAMATSG
jgi:hypothetical protein